MKLIHKHQFLLDAGAPLLHTEFAPIKSSKCGVWSDRYESLKKLSESGGIFGLVGINGGGKTQMSVSLMGHFYNNLGRSIMFIKANEFCRLVLESKTQVEGARRYNAKEFIEPDLLVIDGLENIAGSEFESIELNYLLDKRYDCVDKVTLFTCNWTREATSKLLTGSVVNRMEEKGGWMTFDGISFRIKSRGV